MNALTWYHEQPIGKWLELKDIPFDIFYSIWNVYIEKQNCTIHPFLDKYKILKH